ncbi:hypothetical protein [Sulfurimonas sp.]|nr:hypothetical protein [Sulfurimonas sp.]MDD5157979.1 hypothetical protein [Sulfurimonas sp.]
MKIDISGNRIIIAGNIKSIVDFQNIKKEIDIIVTSSQSVTIEIVDSLSIISSVIGYLNKLVLKDGIDISIKAGSQQLIELLDDLDLTTTLKATRI